MATLVAGYAAQTTKAVTTNPITGIVGGKRRPSKRVIITEINRKPWLLKWRVTMQQETGLNSWIETISQYVSHLCKPQAVVLALWSFGIVMTQSCGLTSVAVFMAILLGKKEDALRQ